MDGDSNDLGYRLLTDEDIIQHVTQSDETSEKNDEDSTEESYHGIPSCGEVKDMLDKCFIWYERQDESTSTSWLFFAVAEAHMSLACI